MNFQQVVVEKLTQFVSQTPQTVEVELLNGEIQSGYVIGVTAADGWSTTVTASDYDRHSIVIRQLAINAPKSIKTTLGLADYAQNIINQVTYLEESFALIEIDLAKDIAQLRSQPPQQADEMITYWEALLHSQPQPRLTLARYRWASAQAERRQLDFPLTFDTLGRISADLVVSLSQKVE